MDRSSKQKHRNTTEEVKGDIIHNMKELELITRKINKKHTRIIINLLYKASIDGDKASAFHKKCDRAQNSIVKQIMPSPYCCSSSWSMRGL